MAPGALVDDASTSSFCVAENKKMEPAPTRHVIRRRHSITFGETTVHEIDKPAEEIRDEIWYSKNEYDCIKAKNKLLVKMKKTGHFQENDENSFRGLEHKLKDGFNQRRTNKFNALNAVLAEQDHQYARGLRNSESVAQKYEHAAMLAKVTALDLGLKDANECGTPAVPVIDPDDDAYSIVSDMGSLCSEDTEKKKLRIKSMFQGISKMHRSHRRASM